MKVSSVRGVEGNAERAHYFAAVRTYLSRRNRLIFQRLHNTNHRLYVPKFVVQVWASFLYISM
jgi:hypothetical protein